MTTDTGKPAASAPGASRVNVLAFPPVTTGRVLILIAAMLAAGLFVGTTVFVAVAGTAFNAAVAECGRLPLGRPPGPNVFAICLAPVERPRALYSASAAAVVALGATAVLFVAPALIERRRRLRPAGPALAPAVQRMQALANDTGLRRPPTLVVGPPALRDAFCYGRPGRYRVAVPTGLAIRPASSDFDAVMRHELAHIAHRDVVLSWIARSVWYALTPVLLVPVVLSLARRDLSILPNYLWRAAVLAAVVLLAQRAVLRSREHDADLRADHNAGAGQAMSAVLTSIRRPPASRLRRALAHHPDATDRLDVLRNPEQVTTVTIVDGLTVAFLATLTVPIVDDVFYAVFRGGTHDIRIPIISAVLVGSLMGATIGLGLWRSSLVSRVTGTRARVGPVAVGVFVGSLLGQAVSLANIAAPIGGFAQPLLTLVVACGATGATVVVAGCGDVWADLSGRLPRPIWNWLPAVVLSAALFSLAFWASALLRTTLEFGSWSVRNISVWAALATPMVCLLAIAVALVIGWALWASNASERAPAWLVGPGGYLPWSRPVPLVGQAVATGVASGVAGAAVFIGFSLVAGPAAGVTERVQWRYTFLWLEAVVGVVAALLFALAHGGRGRGGALLAGPIASATAGVGLLVSSAARGAIPTLGGSIGVLVPGIALGFLLSVATTGLTLPLPPLAQARAPLVLTTAAVVAGCAALGVVTGRDVLAPPFDGQASIQTIQATATRLAHRSYQTWIGPDLFTRRLQLEKNASAINADHSITPSDKAARYRNEILVPLRALLATAESYRPPDNRVAEVHQHCITALQQGVAGNEDVTLALERNDRSLPIQGQTALQNENQEWTIWVKKLGQL